MSKIVGLLFETWHDIDRVLADLRPEDATQPWDGGISLVERGGQRRHTAPRIR
jgi:hypothetical protein